MAPGRLENPGSTSQSAGPTNKILCKTLFHLALKRESKKGVAFLGVVLQSKKRNLEETRQLHTQLCKCVSALAAAGSALELNQRKQFIYKRLGCLWWAGSTQSYTVAAGWEIQKHKRTQVIREILGPLFFTGERQAGAAAVDLTFQSLSLACCFTKSVSSEIGQSYHLPATICLDNTTQHCADPRGALLQNGTDIEPFEVCILSKSLIL